MKINVHSVHFSADKKLVNYINEKVNKLDLFFDNIVVSEVFLLVEALSKQVEKKKKAYA